MASPVLYDSPMPIDDDIAFQRAILENPSDTTLRLVYADWLQDRDDPRAEYVRLQVAFDRRVLAKARFPELRKREQPLRDMAKTLDPAWVGFMTGLAQPFETLTFQDGEPGHPFSKSIGTWRCSSVHIAISPFSGLE